MMNTATFGLLADYNQKANSAMNAFIKDLTADQWTREHKAYFPSIQSLCNHLYVSDKVWLHRFSALRQFAYVSKLKESGHVSFGKNYITDIHSYLEKRAETDELLKSFVSEVTNGDLEDSLTYTDSGGNTHSRRFGPLILHVFNHQTHHRGMISLFLEAEGIDNDFNSLMVYL